MPRPAWRASDRRGLTVLEVLISSVILLLLAIFAVGTLTKALAGMQKSSDTSTGLLVAHSILDSRLQATLTDDTQRDNFFSSAAGLWDSGTGALLDGTEYQFELSTETVAPSAGPLPDGNRLKLVRVVVWWWTADKDEARPEYGRLRAELVRLVNENSRK